MIKRKILSWKIFVNGHYPSFCIYLEAAWLLVVCLKYYLKFKTVGQIKYCKLDPLSGQVSLLKIIIKLLGGLPTDLFFNVQQVNTIKYRFEIDIIDYKESRNFSNLFAIFKGTCSWYGTQILNWQSLQKSRVSLFSNFNFFNFLPDCLQGITI